MRIGKFSIVVLLLVCVTGACAVRVSAQDSAAPKAAVAPSPQPEPFRAYRLDFVLIESEDGKKVDSREYSVDLSNLGAPGRVSAGTRIPAGVKSDGTPQYLDVNTSININFLTRGGVDGVNVNCDVSSVAPDDNSSSGRPVLRTLSIGGSAPLTVGKPMVFGVADDPNSKRQFQLTVTATELK